MASGLKTLHQIDAALRQARTAVSEAASLSQRASEALATTRQKEAENFLQIAKDRLDLIEDGKGGSLGYIDREVEKRLEAHRLEEEMAAKEVAKSETALRKLEDARRKQEKAVAKAIDSYDKAVATSEAALLKDDAYLAQIKKVADAEATVVRAEEKLELARQDEVEKGKPYLEDGFFTYLQNRAYGTKDAKGWFLTKLLDGWVARKIDYRQAAENYRRLTDIPKRLNAHVDYLDDQIGIEQQALQAIEAARLESDGVNALRQLSLEAQTQLESLDKDIEAQEISHQVLVENHIAISAGQSGPMKEAMEALTHALKKMDRRSLSKLAAQTQTITDDRAIDTLRDISETAQDLSDDKSEADRLLRKYQKSQKELEAVRRRFKSRRYDAPSSMFKNDDLISRILGQVVAGALSGSDLWRQLERAQRTLKRYSDIDFGGVDWEDAFRLPRDTGGFGGGSRGRRPSRRRTSLPRRPRQNLPRFPSGGGWGGRSGGGFKIPRGGRSSGGFGGGFGGKSRGGFKTGGGF